MPRCNRRVMPGYPKTTRFTTRAELDGYLNGDRITCLLCGKDYRILDTHLRAQHDMTSDDYRDIYSIPSSRGLVGSDRTARDKARMLNLLQEYPEYKASLIEKAKAITPEKGLKTRSKPAYWKNERTKNSLDLWHQVGAMVISGMTLGDACRQVGITNKSLLHPAKRRWPEFGEWWDKCVEPKRRVIYRAPATPPPPS